MNEAPLTEKKIYSKLWPTNISKEERNESNR